MIGKIYIFFCICIYKECFFCIIKIGLICDCEELYDCINCCVDIMMQDGLLEEVWQVYFFWYLNLFNIVGYKEMFKYLDGEWILEFVIGKIK